MASDIKKPMVLDFFGLPGCGKSTVSHLLAIKLRKEGYKVYEPSYDLDHTMNAVKRKVVKMCQYIVYVILHPIKAKKIDALIKQNGYEDFSEKLSQCINIVSKFNAIDKNGYDFIIFDEGFFQAAVSLSLVNDRVLSFENLHMMLDAVDPTIRICGVYIQVSKDVSLERMSKRGEKNSRIDAQTNESVKLRLLENFSENCKKLHPEADCIIDASGNIEDVFNRLYDQVNQFSM